MFIVSLIKLDAYGDAAYLMNFRAVTAPKIVSSLSDLSHRLRTFGNIIGNSKTIHISE